MCSASDQFSSITINKKNKTCGCGMRLHSRNHGCGEKAFGTQTHNFGKLVELSGVDCPMWNVYSSVHTCLHTLTGIYCGF